MKDIKERLFQLSITVSYLGEKNQFGWWESDFFEENASSFLKPVFPRTQLLAQALGAAAAAARLHDERIGVGRVFHLFRLPQEFEQSFHQRLLDVSLTDDLSVILSSKINALDFLKSEFGTSDTHEVGPRMIGNIADITNRSTVDLIGQTYSAGFQKETPVFPFFRE